MTQVSQIEGLYIVLISVHGLIRGHNLELGRDADTGGQTLYVIELARALAVHPHVARIDLITRLISDSKVSSDYAQPYELIAPGCNIIRLECGPRRYLRKEALWPYLDRFIDKALQHVRSVGQVPDILHSHYADSGYVGARLADLLGVPLVHTGHSLGRDKLKQLLKKGTKKETIESQYNIGKRIEAEEITLDHSALVVASTLQEVEQQYAVYENYQPKRMVVIPPGVDLSRFHPPKHFSQEPRIQAELERFLHEPKKPMILALSRADERKNIATLLQAYGETPELQQLANLVIIAGNRDDIQGMERGQREVLTQLLLAIDRYDLYGKVAYPKQHQSSDVPHFYRLAASTRGVLINPALTEPFGLTLIEAAASGLPVVATQDGGPKDIIANCKNGLLIDPLDADAMAQILIEVLADSKRWARWSKAAVQGAHRYYSWPGHVESYLHAINKVLHRKPRKTLVTLGKSRMPTIDRIAISGIDNTLIGNSQSLHRLIRLLRHTGSNVGFGVATGRSLESALRILKQWELPMPDILITAMGSEIHYGHQGRKLVEDLDWRRHIDYRWDPTALRKAMRDIKGAKLQPKSEQRGKKISYLVNPDKPPKVREIKRHLRSLDLHANLIYSHHTYLDLLPMRASKGLAIRYLALKWGLPLERFFVVGDSGNDEEMLLGDTLAVVVGNHSEELKRLKGKPRIYFAHGEYAQGILEGLEYYQFLGDIRIPQDETPESIEALAQHAHIF